MDNQTSVDLQYSWWSAYVGLVDDSSPYRNRRWFVIELMEMRLVNAVSHEEMKWISSGMSRFQVLLLSGPRIPAHGPASVPGGEGIKLTVGWDPRAAAVDSDAGLGSIRFDRSGPRIPAHGPADVPGGEDIKLTVGWDPRAAAVVTSCVGSVVLSEEGGPRIPAYGPASVPGGEGMKLAVGWDPRAADSAAEGEETRSDRGGPRIPAHGPADVPGGEDIKLTVGWDPRAAAVVASCVGSVVLSEEGGPRIPAYGPASVPGGEDMKLAVGWDPRAAAVDSDAGLGSICFDRSGPRIPAHGPADVPGGEDIKLTVGWDPRAADSAEGEETRLDRGGPRIPAYGSVSCPRGGRHETCCGLGSSGRPDEESVRERRSDGLQGLAILQADWNDTISRWMGVKVLAVRGSRPKGGFHAPGGEGMRLAVGRDPRAARFGDREIHPSKGGSRNPASRFASRPRGGRRELSCRSGPRAALA